MLAHLRDCAACRELAAADDPSVLFGILALIPIPATVLDDLSDEVARRAGRYDRSHDVLALVAAWPRRAAAAAAAALMLLTGYATFRDREIQAPPDALTSRRADVAVSSGGGVSQVIDLTVGDTQIVMVYNGELKL